MIEIPVKSDIDGIAKLIDETVNACIEASEDDRRKIVEHSIAESLDCIEGKVAGAHLLHRSPDGVNGLVLVKDYWNMVSLFVLPNSQRNGIATELLNEVVGICSEISSKQSISLNSSNYASGFYENYGFKLSGQPHDLPGGCIPYTYRFIEEK